MKQKIYMREVPATVIRGKRRKAPDEIKELVISNLKLPPFKKINVRKS